jgi:hypothetical protein
MSSSHLPERLHAVLPSSGDIQCRLAIVGHAICKICNGDSLLQAVCEAWMPLWRRQRVDRGSKCREAPLC